MTTSNDCHGTQEELRVFMSYSKRDMGKVYSLYHVLRYFEFDPWLDAEGILAGQDWELEISKNISKAHAIIACISSKAANKPGYLQKEIKLAIRMAEQQPEGSIFIIPIKLDKCDIPDRLKVWHWVEISEERSFEKLIQALNARSRSLGIATAPFDRLSAQHILPETDYPGPYLATKSERFICGNYLARGRNSAGSQYEGRVLITTLHCRLHVFIWYIGDSVRVSIGRPWGNEITVYGDYQVTYVINEDDSLEGTWGDTGVEKLIPSTD